MSKIILLHSTIFYHIVYCFLDIFSVASLHLFTVPFLPFAPPSSVSILASSLFSLKTIPYLNQISFSQAKTELGWEGSTHKLLTMVRKVNKAEPAKGDVQKWYEQYIALGLDQKPFDSTEDDAIIKSLDAPSA